MIKELKVNNKYNLNMKEQKVKEKLKLVNLKNYPQ